jgi:hypothetical protein
MLKGKYKGHTRIETGTEIGRRIGRWRRNCTYARQLRKQDGLG